MENRGMSPSSHCLRKFLRVLEYGRGILEDTGTLKTFGDLPENWGGDAGDYARRRDSVSTVLRMSGDTENLSSASRIFLKLGEEKHPTQPPP